MGLYITPFYGYTFVKKDQHNDEEYQLWVNDNAGKRVDDNLYDIKGETPELGFNDTLHYFINLGFLNVYSGGFLELGDSLEISEETKEHLKNSLKQALNNVNFPEHLQDLKYWEMGLNLMTTS